tara:strand:- start:148 stop:309 length:162 start_codon:yes stop_codon:yes gene_type:complete
LEHENIGTHAKRKKEKKKIGKLQMDWVDTIQFFEEYFCDPLAILLWIHWGLGD